MPVRAMVVAGDVRTRKLIVAASREVDFAVDWAATALDAWAKCLSACPDLVIFDLDGVDAADAEIAWHICGFCDVIILRSPRPQRGTSRVGDPPAKAVLEKPLTVDGLVATLQALRNEPGLALPDGRKSAIVRFGRYAFHGETRKLVADGREVYLTNLQATLLAFFLSRYGVPLSREQIAKALYGSVQNVNDRAVDVLISRLRTVLAAQGGGDRFIRSIRGIGYVFVAEPIERTEVDVAAPVRGRKTIIEADIF